MEFPVVSNYSVIRTVNTDNSITITAGSYGLVVSAYKMDNTHAFIADTTLDTIVAIGESSNIVYPEDGVYKFTVVEGDENETTSYIVDFCYHDITRAINLDIKDIILGSSSDLNTSKYDFISLVLLSIFYFGNTAYSVCTVSSVSANDLVELSYLYDAIVQSEMYMDINNSISSSTI